MLNASEGFVLLCGGVFARARGQAQSPQFDPPGGHGLPCVIRRGRRTLLLRQLHSVAE